MGGGLRGDFLNGGGKFSRSEFVREIYTLR